MTRLPVLVVLSQGGHNYRFILRPDEARTLGADLIEKAGEATAITGLERLTRGANTDGGTAMATDKVEKGRSGNS